MKLQPTILNQPVNYQNITDNILPYFPWAERWQIKVSGGLTAPLGSLFSDIEEIFGHKPGINFLRVIEEPGDDELFLRRLCIFINFEEEAHQAKYAALEYAINKAKRHSETICFRCGSKLRHEYVGDEDLVSKYFEEQNIDGRKYQFVKFCMHCIKNESSGSASKSSSSEKTEIIELTISETNDKDFPKKEGIKNDLEAGHDVEGLILNKNMIKLYRYDDVDQLEKNYEGATRDHATRVTSLVTRMRENTPEKRLVTIPNNWKNICDDLESDFPNFSDAIRFIRNQVALSAISNQTLRFPPFLLVGDAGIGKTEFMLTLADMVNTRLTVIDIASAQSGAILSGSDTFWSNTKPGEIFNACVFGDVANPVIMLDEIDKAKNGGDYNPLASLHALLEPRQAREFRDLSVPEIRLDASHILWIATANKIAAMEKPILDRFTVFNIAPPSTIQMREIVKNQYKQFIENDPAGGFFDKEIKGDVVDELCLYHPRNVRKMLNLSFGLAANLQRHYLMVDDIRECNISDKKEKRRGMGFMSDCI